MEENNNIKVIANRGIKKSVIIGNTITCFCSLLLIVLCIINFTLRIPASKDSKVLLITSIIGGAAGSFLFLYSIYVYILILFNIKKKDPVMVHKIDSGTVILTTIFNKKIEIPTKNLIMSKKDVLLTEDKVLIYFYNSSNKKRVISLGYTPDYKNIVEFINNR